MTLTFEKEESLPHLPLPELNSSISQALKALKPLVSADDFNKLESKAENFLSSDQAKTLQLHLLKCSQTDNNYLNSQGISSTTSNVYGDLRGKTLPRNPFFILEDDPMKNFAPSQEYRAAVLTCSTLRFIVALKQGYLKPDFNPITKQPYTMSSYLNLFGTTVIPENNGVGMKKYNDSRHILFLSHGQFFSLEVLSENDQIWFSKHELSAIIKQVINESSHSKSNINVGTFTSEMKSVWKMARFSLEQSSPEQMRLIDSALFIICLDHENFENLDEKIQFVTHGTSNVDKKGFQYGTCINRYYDKMNIIVTKNATAACIYPASIIDGTAVLRFISDIYTDSVLRLARMINGKNYTLWTEINTVPINNEIVKPSYQKVNFKITNEISNGLHLAESRLSDIINQHEYVSKKITLGKSYIRDKMKLPTDSFIQICIQITYFALYGKCPSTFEPISTRKFKDARTEAICIQNELILELCQSFITQTSDIQRWKLLLEAVKDHRETTKQSSEGLGFERHLSALRSAFIQRDTLNKLHPDLSKIESNEIPAFIFDPLIEILYKPEVIAANCGNPALDYFGITPSIPTGFGFGYIIKDNYISIVGSSQWRQTGRFLDTFEKVILNIKTLWKSILANSTVNSDSTNRDVKLQEYVNSIPMSMISSNHSNWVASSEPQGFIQTPAEQQKRDNYILGGYDYFDVDKLNFRSGMASKAASRSISRNDSGVNLAGRTASFKNVSSAYHSQPLTIGRLLNPPNDI